MSRAIILGSKLRMKRSSATELEEQIKKLQERSDEVLKAIDDIESEEELEPVEKEVAELEKELDEKLKEKTDLEKEIEMLEQELEALNNKQPESTGGTGDERHMTEDKKQVREGIKAYVRTKGAVRDGFTSVEGGALIPEELLAPKKASGDELDLTKYVNTVSVNSGSGKYPIIKKSNSKMIAVEELAKNPELAKPKIDKVSYDISTYRGYIPVSQEVIDDADYDVVGMIAEEIEDQELNTKNAEVAAAMKAATALPVTGLDGLKGVFNKNLKRVYANASKAFVSSSLYNELDTLKDRNGRYLLQDDITVESGKKINGKEVVVLDDTVIGSADGDMVAFIGDAKSAITLFDRKEATVKWVDNDVYGQLLAGFVRFDVQSVDNEAGFYVTYTPEATEVQGA